MRSHSLARAPSCPSWTSERHNASTSSAATSSSTVPPDDTDRIANFFNPGRRSSTSPDRDKRNVSGMTRPATTASPSPHAASIIRSSAPVIGFRVNITPAQSGDSNDCTTTPTLGRVKTPSRLRYVIAESEFADHQISRTASATPSAEVTFNTVWCWPAKLAAAPSSSTHDDRTASGTGSDDTNDNNVDHASASLAATRSTNSPESATPGGTGNPACRAVPSPTAFAPYVDSSVASTSGTTPATTTPVIPAPSPRRCRH